MHRCRSCSNTSQWVAASGCSGHVLACSNPRVKKPNLVNRQWVLRATGPQSNDQATREAVRRLSKLFYQEPEEVKATAFQGPAGLLSSLPLLCGDWVVLPGMQAILHAHAPHDVHMINAVFARHQQQQQQQQQQQEGHAQSHPLPVFGFIYAPSSPVHSSSLGFAPPSSHKQAASNDPDARSSYEGSARPDRTSSADPEPSHRKQPLRPSLQARIESLPSDQQCGCIVEITRAVKLRDGRFMLLATAVSRMRLLQTTQVLPFVRADVAVFPDEEEVRAAHSSVGLPAALQAADALSQLSTPSVVNSHNTKCAAEEVCEMGDVACEVRHAHWQQAASAAAAAAAVSAAYKWHEYEFHVPRLHRWHEPQHEDPSVPGASASSLVTSLVDMGVVDVITLPGGGAVQGSWEGLQAVADAAQNQASRAAHKAASATLHSVQDASSALPERGSVASNDGSVVRDHQGSNSPSVDGGEGPIVSNASSSRSTFGDDTGSSITGASQASEDEFLVLEHKIWEALDALVYLSRTVNQRAVTLPMGLLQLRPSMHQHHTPPTQSTNSSARPVAPPQTQQHQPEEQQQQQQLQQQQRQQQQQRAPQIGAASDGLDVCAEPAWPAERRAQRLSYALLALLLDPTDTRGRQQLLSTRRIAGRLRVCLEHLQSMVDALAAKRAVLNVVGEVEQRAKGSYT